MDLTRNRVRALAAACALTLLVAACSGDEDDSAEVVDDTEQTTEAADDATEPSEDTEPADGDTTTTAADEETTTTGAEEPDDSGDGSGDGTEGDPDAVAVAQRINLTIDDFDEGWTESPPEDDDAGPNIDDCFVETDIEAATVGEAETGTFGYEPGGEALQLVTMQTVVLDSVDSATAVVSEFNGDAFTSCAAGIMRDGFGGGATAELALRPDDPAWTEESAGVVGDIAIPDDGGTVNGVVDLHVFRTGEVLSFTAIVDVGVDDFEALLGQTYAIVADRHAAELG